jgi:hypothetical protein
VARKARISPATVMAVGDDRGSSESWDFGSESLGTFNDGKMRCDDAGRNSHLHVEARRY